MLIKIRVPRHPLAHATIGGALEVIGVPRIESSGRDSWVSMRVDNTKPSLTAALEGLVRINELLMRAWASQGHQVPSIYDLGKMGFRYKPEPPGREWWQTWVDNALELEGDCEDIGGHQAAYYRHHGHPASAACKKTGKRIYHAVVEHPNGHIEDPSLPLGLEEYRRQRRARALRAKGLREAA